MSQSPTEQRIEQHLDVEIDRVRDDGDMHAALLARRAAFLGDALDRCGDWKHASIPDPSMEAACDVNATSWVVWHLPVGDRGMVKLTLFAQRKYGDRDLGQDLAMDAYVNTLGRLDACVARHVDGLSLPDFRRPDSRPNADNVTSYLRTAVDWLFRNHYRSAKKHTSWDEDEIGATMAAPSSTPTTPRFDIESDAVRFASLWLLADTKKDHSRWWSMLRHALGFAAAGFDPRGPQRNDPARMEHKLRVRLRAALGLGATLKRWIVKQNHPFWNMGGNVVPIDLAANLPRVEMDRFLAEVRPALEGAIADLRHLPETDGTEPSEVDEDERGALRSVLVKGGLIEPQLGRFQGADKTTRLDRLYRLAEAAGHGASHILTPPPGGATGDGGTGGPTCDHAGTRARMRGVAFGAVPDVATMRDDRDILRSCGDCRDWWQGTCEEVEHLPHLAEAALSWHAEPEAETEAAPGLFRGWAWVPIAAGAAVVALLAVFQPWNDAPAPDDGQYVEVDPDAHGTPEETPPDPHAPPLARLAALAFTPDGPPEGVAIEDGAKLAAATRVQLVLDAPKPGLVVVVHRHPSGDAPWVVPGPEEDYPTWAGGEALIRHADGRPVNIVLPDEPGRHQLLAFVGSRSQEILQRSPTEIVHEAPELAPRSPTELADMTLELLGKDPETQMAILNLYVRGVDERTGEWLNPNAGGDGLPLSRLSSSLALPAQRP